MIKGWARPDSNWGPSPRQRDVIATRLRAQLVGKGKSLKYKFFDSQPQNLDLDSKALYKNKTPVFLRPLSNQSDIKMNKSKLEEIKKIIDEVKREIDIKVDTSVLDEVVNLLKEEVKKKQLKVEVFIGGSFAKQTFLGNDFDCDIFLRFDMSYREESLSDLSEELLKQFKPVRVHGSRDYFNFEYKNVLFEVVPVYLIQDPSQAKNTTDVSPFHVLWFNKKKEKNPDLPLEVKVTKVFLKAQKLYGAESYINGFSGHVVDILVSHYGSFLNLIKNASKWTFPVIIDTEKHYKNLNPIFFLNKDKIKNEVIVIDPIIKERNAASALSKENTIKFIKICKRFLEQPSKDFFEIKFLDLNSAKERIGENPGVIFQLTPLDEKSKDVAGTKMFKAFEFVKEQLEINEFKVLDSFFDWNKKDDAFCYLIFDKKPLSKEKIILGPPDKKEFHKNILNFKSKYKDKVFLEDGRYFAKVTRRYTNPFELIDNLVKNERFLTKVKDFKVYKINKQLIEDEV